MLHKKSFKNFFVKKVEIWFLFENIFFSKNSQVSKVWGKIGSSGLKSLFWIGNRLIRLYKMLDFNSIISFPE